MPHFSPLREELLGELFARANAERLGIAVETTNVNALLTNLSVYRKKNNLHQFSICTTPDVNTLFIVHKSVELEP